MALLGLAKRTPFGRLASIFILVGVALIIYWVLVDFVLSSSRGFELTDEALYLLAAREIGSTAQWGFPWGWHTAPLYALVGGDVSSFRTIGGVILSLSGGALGAAAFLALNRNLPLRTFFQQKQWATGLAVFTLAGWATSFLYYSHLNRAPSYNWVVLEGLILAGIGGLLIIRNTSGGRRSAAGLYRLAGIALVAFGLIYSSPGKPTTPVFFLIILFLSWLASSGVRTATVLFLQVALAAIGVMAVFVAFGVWPVNFLQSFLDPIQGPSLTGAGLSEAVQDLVSLPVSVLRILIDLGPGIFAALALALLAWVLSFVLARWKLPLRVLATGVGLIVPLWLFVLQPLIDSELGAGSFVAPRLTVTLLIIMMVGVFYSLTLFFEKDQKEFVGRERLSLAIALILISMPLIFGFGSGNGVLRHSDAAGIGFALASLALLYSSADSGRWLTAMRGSVAALVFVLSIVTLSDGHRAPYRLQPMNMQTQWVELNDSGRSRLMVDSATREKIVNLLSVTEAAGFTPGTPVIGLRLTTRWFSAETYALGAGAPQSLMPTLWGYPGSLDLAIDNLKSDSSDFEWNRAWVLVGDQEGLDESDMKNLSSYLEHLERKSGLTFPGDYALIGQAAGMDIYRPAVTP